MLFFTFGLRVCLEIGTAQKRNELTCPLGKKATIVSKPSELGPVFTRARRRAQRKARTCVAPRCSRSGHDRPWKSVSLIIRSQYSCPIMIDLVLCLICTFMHKTPELWNQQRRNSNPASHHHWLCALGWLPPSKLIFSPLQKQKWCYCPPLDSPKI